LYIN